MINRVIFFVFWIVNVFGVSFLSIIFKNVIKINEIKIEIGFLMDFGIGNIKNNGFN